MKFNDKIYDILKWVCLIVLPACAVLYTAIDGVFAWGYAKPVCAVIAAVEAFIGALIGVSTNEYNKEKKDEGIRS